MEVTMILAVVGKDRYSDVDECKDSTIWTQLISRQRK